MKTKVTLGLILLVIGLWGLASCAQAHEEGDHGWYPSECCSHNDCEPVPCNALDIHSDKLVIYDHLQFTNKQVKLSPDGECHVCIHHPDGYAKFPVCVFIHTNM